MGHGFSLLFLDTNLLSNSFDKSIVNYLRSDLSYAKFKKEKKLG